MSESIPSPSISLWTPAPFPSRQRCPTEQAVLRRLSGDEASCGASPSSSVGVPSEDQPSLQQQPASLSSGSVNASTCSREPYTTARSSRSPPDNSGGAEGQVGGQPWQEAASDDVTRGEMETRRHGNSTGHRLTEEKRLLAVSPHISPTQIQFSPRQERCDSPPSLETHTSHEGACASPLSLLECVSPSVACSHEAVGHCPANELSLSARRGNQPPGHVLSGSCLRVPQVTPFHTTIFPPPQHRAGPMLRHTQLQQVTAADAHAGSLLCHRTTAMSPAGTSAHSAESTENDGIMPTNGEGTLGDTHSLLRRSAPQSERCHILGSRHGDELSLTRFDSLVGVAKGGRVSVRHTEATSVHPLVLPTPARRANSPDTLGASNEMTIHEPSIAHQSNGPESDVRITSPSCSLPSAGQDLAGDSPTPEGSTGDGQPSEPNCLFPTVGPSMTGRDLFLLEMWLAPELCRDLQPPSTLSQLRRQLLNLWEEKLTPEQREVYNEVIVRRYTEERQGVEEWKFENSPPWWKAGY
ncbi:hypothetical protein TGGT1_254320 [Toxoplasma gondii GT1]|uniref:Uncharacterized protein n=3 Tax=Toxoplasma gondii TaxID=5811 RepID=S7UN16_TOXGG|nr:hypothetical protein TGGT1_254320 [Toxoplasma gondii GT1]KAF4645301.1 hypothetical protein TGRH88_004030 [Toxoplasma gondii]KFG53014.1 hypothetical protein TGFOU_254320 [Toxoplasma gondii FOU]